MRTAFQYDCPHCQTKKSGFFVTYQHNHRSIRIESHAVAICSVCDRPVIFHYSDLNRMSGRNPIDLLNNFTDFPGPNIVIIETWPHDGSDTPDSLPENVARFYEQAVQNEKSENWDAAGAMFRKALDVATKILDPSSSSKNLFSRIESLLENGKITSDLAKWAHEVRIDGNSSVHDESPETSEDLAAIHNFCRSVLLYTFTMPELVASRNRTQDTSMDH